MQAKAFFKPRFPVAFKFKIQKVYIVFGAGLRLFRFGSGVRLIFMSDLSRYKNNNKCEQQQQQRRTHAQQERDRKKERGIARNKDERKGLDNEARQGEASRGRP